MIAICMALSSVYGSENNSNLSGARAAIAMIFIYSCGYAVFFNATIWVVPSELFPFFLRSTGMGLAVFSKSVAAIVLSQITPTAMENVGWRYYALFIATNFAAAFVYFFLLPETSGKTLEEIAELFGDSIVREPSKTANDEPGAEYGQAAEKGSNPEHVEKAV
jgi:dipeptide/tripeptide permease